MNRIATAVIEQGFILPITPPSPNSTWELKFYGPALSCSKVTDQASFFSISKAILKFATGADSKGWNQSLANYENHNDSLWFGYPFVYLCWATQQLSLHDYDSECVVNFPSLGPEDEPATLNVATMPKMDTVECQWPADPRGTLPPSTAIQCLMYNASYQVNFTYVDGAQTIGTIQRELNLVEGPIKPIHHVLGPSIEGGHCFKALKRGDGSDDLSCSINETVSRTLGYQSVLDAFNQGIVGSVSASLWENESVENTDVQRSMLLQTSELAFLREGKSPMEIITTTSLSSQNALSQQKETAAQAVYQDRPYPNGGTLSNTSLLDALEATSA